MGRAHGLLAPIVIVGLGEIGGVFARGFLRCGHPVFPVTRNMDLGTQSHLVPEPALVLIAVTEDDLGGLLEQVPEGWRSRVGLIQNELLPRDWQRCDVASPTIAVIWFEKKPGQDSKVILPSPVYGPATGLVCNALSTVAIACRALASEHEMLFELVRKNVYILTTNIAGLVAGVTVNELWLHHEALAREVAGEIIAIQEYLTGHQFSHDRLIDGMLEAFSGDPEHRCTGRSAPRRLQRAIDHAAAAGIPVPRLIEIQKSVAAAH